MEEEKKYLDYEGLQTYHENLQSVIEGNEKVIAAALDNLDNRIKNIENENPYGKEEIDSLLKPITDKLEDIEEFAEVNVLSDWNQTDSDADDYIKNKPTSMPASDVSAWAKASSKPSYTKDEIGLSNVTNDALVKRSEMGTASGVATLDSAGKVPSSQLPAYVDDVLEYDTRSAFPTTGEGGKIYIDKSNNTSWRWSGSTYTQIKGDLTIGTTSGTVADGGIANTHYNNTSNPHSVTKEQVGLGNVVNTGDSATPISGGTTKFTTGGAYTELAKKVDKVSGKGLSTNDYTTDEKNKLSGIASGAQANVIETVKVNGAALTPSSKAVNVTVPTKTSELTNNSNFVSDTSYVHTDNNYTATEKSKLNGIASGAEVNQNAFSNVGVKVGNTTTTVAADAKTDTVTLIQGSNVTLTADTTNDTITIAAKDTTYSAATTTAAGLMSADDKTKLNGIAAGAEVNVQSDWNATSGDALILNKPTIPSEVTESTVSGWGFTKNAGTITGIKMNGSLKGTSGVVDLGTVITSHQSLSNYYTKTQVDALTRHTRLTDFDLNILKQAVADQNLEKYGLRVGDQKTINGYTYVIADLNTMKGTLTPYRLTLNHVGLIVIPHVQHAWNSSGRTDTGSDSRGAGYKNCDLHDYLKNTVLPHAKNDLGADNLLAHLKLLTNAVNANGYNRFGNNRGCSSSWKWVSDLYISALSEVLVYGSTIWSSSGYDTGEACRLLEVFKKYSHTEIFGGEYPWLRDIASVTHASSADDYGGASYCTVSYSALWVAGLLLFH